MVRVRPRVQFSPAAPFLLSRGAQRLRRGGLTARRPVGRLGGQTFSLKARRFTYLTIDRFRDPLRWGGLTGRCTVVRLDYSSNFLRRRAPRARTVRDANASRRDQPHHCARHWRGLYQRPRRTSPLRPPDRIRNLRAPATSAGRLSSIACRRISLSKRRTPLPAHPFVPLRSPARHGGQPVLRTKKYYCIQYCEMIYATGL